MWKIDDDVSSNQHRVQQCFITPTKNNPLGRIVVAACQGKRSGVGMKGQQSRPFPQG
jgi:hypothetical protein